MNGYKPYSHICQASLRVFFTKVPNKIYLNVVKEFYSNLYMIGKTLTSSVKIVRIMIHIEQFSRMFEITFLGTSYKSERPIGLKTSKDP